MSRRGCTCATTHIAIAAIARLRSCPPVRSSEAPDAEYTTASPSAMVRARAAASGPSMRRERRSKPRLIMLVVLVRRRSVDLGLRGFLFRGLLAEEVVIEHLARDRCRRRAAVLPVLD